MAAKSDADAKGDQPAEGQPTEAQPPAEGQRQEIRLRIDERNLHTSYANAFRTDATADEVMLYFGLNLINPAAAQQGTPEFIFQVNERIVVSYRMAKRLALALGQLIRRHEEQFGEISLERTPRGADAGAQP
ncbi:MAG TPA: DUF3467 domain-containing protein [Phycisphaerae bacterium]|nr:DUF3467 domain-containing protein [Phycisphaerae bacterium]